MSYKATPAQVTNLTRTSFSFKWVSPSVSPHPSVHLAELLYFWDSALPLVCRAATHRLVCGSPRLQDLMHHSMKHGSSPIYGPVIGAFRGVATSLASASGRRIKHGMAFQPLTPQRSGSASFRPSPLPMPRHQNHGHHHAKSRSRFFSKAGHCCGRREAKRLP